MDKYKDNGILLEILGVLKSSKEVMRMAENDSQLLNTVYREISESLGMNTAMTIYQMYKGQQISLFGKTRLSDKSGIREGGALNKGSFSLSQKMQTALWKGADATCLLYVENL